VTRKNTQHQDREKKTILIVDTVVNSLKRVPASVDQMELRPMNADTTKEDTRVTRWNLPFKQLKEMGGLKRTWVAKKKGVGC
jgi:hypothetical protein